MDVLLLMAGSITHAQRMAAMLENRGIRAAIARAPAGVDPRGCGYGVKIRRADGAQALELLRHVGIKVRGVYERDGETWREVAM
jgi:hypothetical protein